MKIALLASTFLPTIGGAEVVTHNLAIHLGRLGHDVHVITWWGNWMKVRGKLPYPVHPLLPRSHSNADQKRLHAEGITRSWVFRQVDFHHWRKTFDVLNIHTAYPFGPLCANRLANRHIPSVMTCHGSDLLFDSAMRHGLRCNPVLGKALVESILACDQVTAHSGIMETAYREIGVPSGKITRAPNGVDVARPLCVSDASRRLREEHGIPPTAPLLLTIGRNVIFKGFRFIPDILQRLSDVGSPVWWVVIGADSELLQSLPGVAQMQGRLITLPAFAMAADGCWREQLSHMPPDPLIQWYRTADLYVHPALLEPFGNVVVEAMAAGLPLVVTDGTGAANCVEKARCGLVVPRGNVQEMASAIQQMLENQALRQEMAARAKTGAAEYDWPLIARRYVAAYEAALGRSTTG